jgi:hypothetical protein
MNWQQQDEANAKDIRERTRNLCDRCRQLFYGSEDWMGIRHPALGYESPLGWIRSGKPIETVEELLTKEEKELQ